MSDSVKVDVSAVGRSDLEAMAQELNRAKQTLLSIAAVVWPDMPPCKLDTPGGRVALVVKVARMARLASNDSQAWETTSKMIASNRRLASVVEALRARLVPRKQAVSFDANGSPVGP